VNLRQHQEITKIPVLCVLCVDLGQSKAKPGQNLIPVLCVICVVPGQSKAMPGLKLNLCNLCTVCGSLSL